MKKMFQLAMKYYKKYKEAVLYLFFGGCTTFVNIAAYGICANGFRMPTIPANGIALVLGILFAYVTNKNYVFESKTESLKETIRELAAFVACRIATGVLDMVIMYVSIDILHYPDMLMKVITNGIVIVLNYLFSKLLIFRKNG